MASTRTVAAGTALSSTSPDPDKLRDIMASEALNDDNFKASAQMMKNMTPQEMEQMIEQLDNLPAEQLEGMKSLGMDPKVVKKSMEMMKSNPSMMKSVASMMESMTPQEMMAQSREAQERLKDFSPEEVAQVTDAIKDTSPEEFETMASEISDMARKESATPGVVDAVLETESADDESNDDDEEEEAEREVVPLGSNDPEVIDAMFKVAELMSNPPTGGVTLAAFRTLPVVSVLSGNAEQDLSPRELNECWASGSLGMTRVDRAGFERVWNEVQEYFEEDIMLEARETSSVKKRGAAKPATTTVAPATGPVVGSQVSPEQISEQMKNMSGQDMDMMLEQMSNLTPEAEARMKAMGVNPEIMTKSANMMKNNPLMKKAMEMAVKNMSPADIMKASQQAQEQMKNLSADDIDRVAKDLESRGNAEK